MKNITGRRSNTMENKIKKADMKFIGNTFKRYDVVFEKGNGSVLTDVNGKKYIDFLGGVAVNVLGYNDKLVNAAAIGQIKKFIHTSNLFYSLSQVELADDIVKNSFGSKVYFVNSGAEATEVAFKIARKWGIQKKDGAYKIVTMFNSFHGRTIAALTATGQEKFHKYLKPLSPGFVYAKFNDVEDLEKKIDKETCAVLVEPIQAEGGVKIPDADYFKKVRALCEKHNVLLIADEIQTGLGRTGKLFGYENFGIEPDMMTIGKGLGGGFPLSAVVVGKGIENVFSLGDHGTTMGGNPVACAAGKAVFDRIKTKAMLKSINKKGRYIMDSLKKIKSDKIVDVRGKGMIIGLELAGDIAGDVVVQSLKKGLILNAPKPNVIRIVPPFIVTKAEIDRAVKILSEVLA
jgi:acetylornithine/N-succinyldiaminopimelate aminotransferase